MSFLTFISRLMPSKMRKGYKKIISCSTIRTDPEKYMSLSILLGIIAGLLLVAFVEKYHIVPPAVLFIAGFSAVLILFYVYASLSASQKARAVEEALPDALQLMASNIRAGLTTDRALLLAARPEFGPLAEEIRRIGKETMAGRDLVESLKKTTDKIISTNLDRAIELIVNSLRSGGHLADLLDETAEDIRDQQIVQKEISASVLMYVMFMFIALAFGAPMLFAMSSFLVKMLTTNMALIASEMPKDFGVSANAPIKITSVKITADFIFRYSLVSISMSCIFGSLIIGLILRGEEKEGFKYMPILLFIALALYLLANYVLNATLGGMLINVK